MARLTATMLNHVSSTNKSKNPLVFIHGIGSTSKIFQEQIEEFGKKYFAVSIDLPGYGKSTTIETVTIPNYAISVYNFLLSLKIKSPILLGHSLGGMVVQQIISYHPFYARAAILVGTSPKFGGNDTAWKKKFLDSRLKPLKEGKKLKDISTCSISNIVGPKTDSKVIDFASEMMSSISEKSYISAVKSLLLFDLKDELKKIPIPVLVIAGENDNQAPAKMMERMAKNIKKSQFKIINGSGHLINIEKPKEFNEALSNFFLKYNL